MFLNKLELIEKEAFVSLSVKATEADRKVTDEERQVIEDYCKEMDIEFIGENNVMPIEDAIDIFSRANDQNKKIAVLEIIGLMYADGTYDDEERVFVNSFANRIGVSDDTVNKIEEALAKYIDITKELFMSIA